MWMCIADCVYLHVMLVSFCGVLCTRYLLHMCMYIYLCVHDNGSGMSMVFLLLWGTTNQLCAYMHMFMCTYVYMMVLM